MVVAKKYTILVNNHGVNVIAVGEKSVLEDYMISNFGPKNVISSEELDGSVLIHPDLLSNSNFKG